MNELLLQNAKFFKSQDTHEQFKLSLSATGLKLNESNIHPQILYTLKFKSRIVNLKLRNCLLKPVGSYYSNHLASKESGA